MVKLSYPVRCIAVKLAFPSVFHVTGVSFFRKHLTCAWALFVTMRLGCDTLLLCGSHGNSENAKTWSRESKITMETTMFKR